jgi:hypothetical protein
VAILTSAAFDASLVNVGSVRFAFAAAFASDLKDIDGDGDRDLVLQFRAQDTNLREVYDRLLVEDIDGDGLLDSNHQAARVSLTGQTVDEFFVGFDDLDLLLSGKNLRNLLEELAASGAI